MRAQDLMVGDFVRVKHIDKIGKIYRIDAANGAGNEYAALLDGDFDCKDLEPIPLTPEILEKNGFTRYGQVYANLQQWVGKFGDKRKSFVQDIRTGEWGMNDVWINYVHELQHVLKLCKIEKDIVL